MGSFLTLDIPFQPDFLILPRIEYFGKTESDSISKHEKEPFFAVASFVIYSLLIMKHTSRNGNRDRDL